MADQAAPAEVPFVTPFGDNDPAANTPEPSPVVNPPAAPIIAGSFAVPPADPAVPGTPAPQQQQPVDEATQITELANRLGMNPQQLLGFGTVAAAEQAARLYFENTAAQGFGHFQVQPTQPVYQQPAPQQQPAPTVQIDLTALGLVDTDPAAKAIRALEAQQRQQNEALNGRLAQFEQQQVARQRAELQRTTDAVMDGFADPRYGTGSNVTIVQQVNRERLYSLSMGILNANRAAGMPDPPIPVLLERARLIDIQTQNPAAPLAPQQKIPVLPTRSPSQNHQPAVAATNGQWSQDPALRQALGIV